jgi:hypothetical protein
MEEDVVRALIHESGHAVVAVLQQILCDGIYYLKDKRRFCTIAYFPTELLKEHYLFYAGGVAAERIFYGKEECGPSKADKSVFDKAGAPVFEITVHEIQPILLGRKEEIEMLRAKLIEKVAQGGIGLCLLPDTYKSLNGADERCALLLSKDDVEGVVHRR